MNDNYGLISMSMKDQEAGRIRPKGLSLERPLPSSTEYEAALLGCCMKDPKAWNAVQNSSVSLFFIPVHVRIFNTMRRVGTDLVSIIADNTELDHCVTEIYGKVVTTAEWDKYLVELQQLDSRRNLIRQLDRNYDQLYDPTYRLDVIMSEVSLATAPRATSTIWKDETIELDKDLYNPQGMGMLTEIANFYLETSPTECKETAMHTALATLSTYLGRRFATTSGNFSALYYAVIARSGGGKGHSYKVIRKVLKDLDPILENLLMGSGYTSDSAIFKALQDAPNHMTYLDELGDYIVGSRRGGNGSTASQWRVLKEVWACNDSIAPRNYSDHTQSKKSKAQMKCEVPQITIFGCSTAEQFWGALGPNDSADGFLNRWLIITSDRLPFMDDSPQYLRETKLPDAMKDWHSAMCVRSPISITKAFGEDIEAVSLIGANAAEDPDPVYLEWDTGVAEYFRAHYNETIRQTVEDNLRYDMFRRSGQMAMTVSMIVELSKNPMAVTISMESAEWAVRYVDKVLHQMVQYAKRNLAGSDEESLAQKFLNEVRKAGSRGLTMSQFYKKKPSGGERNKIREALKRLDDFNPPVIRCENNYKQDPSKPGRGAKTWFAAGEEV